MRNRNIYRDSKVRDFESLQINDNQLPCKHLNKILAYNKIPSYLVMIKVGIFIVFAIYLASCGVANPAPKYPEHWAPLVDFKESRGCPDISGKYRVLSESMPEMKFSSGDVPIELFLIIPIRKDFPYPLPSPSSVSPRFLPAHLFNAVLNQTNQSEWEQLGDLYQKWIPAQKELRKEWVVEINLINDERLEIIVRDQQNILAQRILTSKFFSENNTGKFDCNRFGLEIDGAYVNNLSRYDYYKNPSFINKPPRDWELTGGCFYFKKGEDGSLVMLERGGSYYNSCDSSWGWDTWWKWPIIEKFE